MFLASEVLYRARKVIFYYTFLLCSLEFRVGGECYAFLFSVLLSKGSGHPSPPLLVVMLGYDFMKVHRHPNNRKQSLV